MYVVPIRQGFGFLLPYQKFALGEIMYFCCIVERYKLYVFFSM